MCICGMKYFLGSMKTADVVCVRHAQSLYNEQTGKYLEARGVGYSWKTLGQDEEYLKTLKYAAGFVDCSINEKGLTECIEARQALNGFKPDLILVSPLNRTLETCSQIFESSRCPVVVEPTLAQSLRSACDFSCDLKRKMARYPQYDLGPTLNRGDFWFIMNESDQNQAKYQQIISTNIHKAYEQITRNLLDYMRDTKIYQTPATVRRRAQKIKLLLKQYKKDYQKIAVISHHSTLKFLLAEQFDQNDEPLSAEIENCGIRRLSLL